MATDEEVQARRDRVDELRARVQEAKTSGGTAHQELVNDITVAQLDVEEASLKAELADLERANDPIRLQASSTPLATAKEQMVAAVAREKAIADANAAQDAAAGAASAPTTPKAASTKPATEKVEG